MGEERRSGRRKKGGKRKGEGGERVWRRMRKKIRKEEGEGEE